MKKWVEETQKWVFDIHAALNHLDDNLWCESSMPWVTFYGYDEEVLERYCWDGDVVEVPKGTAKVAIEILSKKDNATRIAVLDSRGVNYSEFMILIDASEGDDVKRCPECNQPFMGDGTQVNELCPICRLTK